MIEADNPATRHYPFLRHIILDKRLLRKKSYLASELQVTDCVQSILQDARDNAANWLHSEQAKHKQILDETIRELDRLHSKQWLDTVQRLELNQRHYEEQILDHCETMLTIAWEKLTDQIPDKEKIRCVLKQLRPSILSGIYSRVVCHPNDAPVVQKALHQWSEKCPQIGQLDCVVDNNIQALRIKIESMRGGALIADYQLCLEALKNMFHNPTGEHHSNELSDMSQ